MAASYWQIKPLDDRSGRISVVVDLPLAHPPRISELVQLRATEQILLMLSARSPTDEREAEDGNAIT